MYITLHATTNFNAYLVRNTQKNFTFIPLLGFHGNKNIISSVNLP